MPFDVNVALKAVRDAIRDTAAAIDRVHAPSWEARAEVARSLVAVGSAIFAGTAALAEQLIGDECLRNARLVIVGWAALLVSVGLGLYVLWLGVALRSFYPVLFNKQPEIEAKLRVINPLDADADQQAEKVLREATDSVNQPIGRADRHAFHAIRWCAILFGAGLLMLFAYVVQRYWR